MDWLRTLACITGTVGQELLLRNEYLSDWGYDRIVGAMSNLGYRLSDQAVGNILQRHNIPPAPER